ncbi:DNA N-6-adenine-methyltransferase [Pasteurella multocida]|uniref:DNA N-6-adenine-methyltransferase n=1 Tax=Pasteurella multocida TaxID=747 RepID=UPI002A521DDB|nr:DNA N-6-adenine-methyltransferase [Pasteurella multocida]MDY0489693.1 phage N-6-adenine-methyltransferase [Pasteurella multocida]MDY0669959.1 phage N-6-adenine-methyltransferase [Pasteurella multocida]MDY0721490.1 phage N-6-adenine-methyltransferase [Pasteurella multocida]MEB4493913.1 DNA N-6-adenine-methyltransferase [Pasteurella multocida]MEB4501606.1 DNA N-6-adenine-methyltransferase [Pasteurella multocida]
MSIQFNKDHYRTPKYVFNWLEYRFAWFHVDGCATKQDSLAPNWIGKGSDICEDFLADELFNRLLCEVIEQGEPLRIFVNPPYSNPLPFVQRAAELMKKGHLVVMLLPADKSTKWYQVIQDNATEVIDIVGGRINFLHPITGEEVKGNNKGSMVAVFDPTMQGFITRSVSLDFVKQVGCYGN